MYFTGSRGAVLGLLVLVAIGLGLFVRPNVRPLTTASGRTYDLLSDLVSRDGRHYYIKYLAHSTDPDKLVTALEATDHVGTMGRIQFYGRDNQFTHALKYGPGLVTIIRHIPQRLGEDEGVR